jgi:hypothetical protein
MARAESISSGQSGASSTSSACVTGSTAAVQVQVQDRTGIYINGTWKVGQFQISDMSAICDDYIWLTQYPDETDWDSNYPSGVQHVSLG